ncbi:MAG: hypothetical protein M1839_001276 [Geoglossum umbratile]|nr:MAG: hypothetical protein M1839_001276 [Geoglossum umbratile]
MEFGRVEEPLAVGLPEARKAFTYLLKLERPLVTAAKVQKAAGLASALTVILGTGYLGKEIGFCLADAVAKDAILGLSNTTFRPVFIWIAEAEKSLSSSSIYTTLGIDSTLYSTDRSVSTRVSPRQRRTSIQCGISSTTLTDPDVLSRLFSLTDKPELRPAGITGGVITT